MCICGLSPGVSQAIGRPGSLEHGICRIPREERLSGHVKLTDKKIETQRGNITYLRSHSKFRVVRTGPCLLEEAEALWGLL